MCIYLLRHMLQKPVNRHHVFLQYASIYLVLQTMLFNNQSLNLPTRFIYIKTPHQVLYSRNLHYQIFNLNHSLPFHSLYDTSILQASFRSFLTFSMLYIHADSFLAPQSRSNLNYIIINRYENSLLLCNIAKVGTLVQPERIRLVAHFPNDLPPNPTFLLLLGVQFSRCDLIFYAVLFWTILWQEKWGTLWFVFFCCLGSAVV